MAEGGIKMKQLIILENICEQIQEVVDGATDQVVKSVAKEQLAMYKKKILQIKREYAKEVIQYKIKALTSQLELL